jgi:hypothetical protein
MGVKARYVMLSVLVGLSWSNQGFAQQKITCPDKTQRITIDLKQIQIQYNASSFAGTLASLGALSAPFGRAKSLAAGFGGNPTME